MCEYTKELSALLNDKGSNYDFFLPEFDYNNDQLILDFRSDDAVELDQFDFRPCKV